MHVYDISVARINTSTGIGYDGHDSETRSSSIIGPVQLSASAFDRV